MQYAGYISMRYIYIYIYIYCDVHNLDLLNQLSDRDSVEEAKNRLPPTEQREPIHKKIHTHTHTYTYLYIYLCIYVNRDIEMSTI